MVSGTHGIRDQRNYILKYFAPDTRIVEVDDDIKGNVCYISSPKVERWCFMRARPCCQHGKIFYHLWTVANERGCSLWGLNPVRNPHLLAWTYTVGLAKSTAQIQGYINFTEGLTLTVPVMEDYERCFSIYRNKGTCLCANFFSPITQNRAGGGCKRMCAEAFVEPATLHQHHQDPRHIVESRAVNVLKPRYDDVVKAVIPPKKDLRASR